MNKSRFSGSTLGNGRWDEEEHPRGEDGRFAAAGSLANETRSEIIQKIQDSKKRVKELEGKTTEAAVTERYKARNEIVRRKVKLNRASDVNALKGDVRKHAISRFEKTYGVGSFKRTLGL